MLQDKVNKELISFLNLQFFYNVFFLGVQLEFPGQRFYIVYAVLNLLIFVKFLTFIRLDFRKYSTSVNVIWILYTLYSIYVITNFNGNYSLNNVLRYTYLPSGFMFYLAPLLVAQFSYKDSFPILLRFIYKQSVIYVVLLGLCLSYDIIQNVSSDKVLNHLEGLQLYIGGGLIFLVFFIDLLTKAQRKFVWIAVWVTVITAAFFARRAILATYVLGVVFYIIGKTISTRSFSRKIQYILFFSILFVAAGYILFAFGESLFPALAGRLEDDTRTGVELEVLDLLERSGKYLTGLGINSFYYSEYVDEMRDGCETGYLNMIMKGGIVYLCLFYLLCLPVLIKNIFKKRKSRFRIMCVLYAFLVIIVGNGASSTFSFSIRYITFIFIIFYLYNKDTQTNSITKEI